MEEALPLGFIILLLCIVCGAVAVAIGIYVLKQRRLQRLKTRGKTITADGRKGFRRLRSSFFCPRHANRGFFCVSCFEIGLFL